MGRREQRVDRARPCAWPGVCEKRRGFSRRRRQSDQIQVGAAQEDERSGVRRRFEALVLTRSFEEPIDRILERDRHVGNGRLHRQLEGPVVSRRGRDVHVFERGECTCAIKRRRRRAGNGLVPVSPLIDPRFDGGNLLRRERALHRHRGLLESGDSTIQAALLRAARNNRHTLIAALQRGFAGT